MRLLRARRAGRAMPNCGLNGHDGCLYPVTCARIHFCVQGSGLDAFDVRPDWSLPVLTDEEIAVALELMGIEEWQRPPSSWTAIMRGAPARLHSIARHAWNALTWSCRRVPPAI